MKILAIETSCDETSIAILDNKVILSNIISSQIELHQPYGGVVPELAARAHLTNFPYVLQEALSEAKVSISEIEHIVYTATPGLMGCLLVGKTISETLSLYLEIPLLKLNHLHGHLYAATANTEWKFPVLGLLVSGGHTELVSITSHLEFKTIGSTLDDAVGECFDKVARLLGLSYPGGPEIQKAALKGSPTYKLPLPKNDKSLDFSFSGLKSAAANLIGLHKELINVNDFASSLQHAIVDILMIKMRQAIKLVNPATIVLAGGVSANSALRTAFISLKNEFPQLEVIVPNITLCTDNAAMMGLLGYYNIIGKK